MQQGKFVQNLCNSVQELFRRVLYDRDMGKSGIDFRDARNVYTKNH